MDLAPPDRDPVRAEDADDQDMAVFAATSTRSARLDVGWPGSSAGAR